MLQAPLRNEFLVNWMFCPLIFEMSEVKIKKVGVAPHPESDDLGRGGKLVVINFAGRKLQHSPLFFGGKGGRLPLVFVLKRCGNDPSAGSPTETLLRLHLPLTDEV